MTVEVRVLVHAHGPTGLGASERVVKGPTFPDVLACAQCEVDGLVPEALRLGPAEVTSLTVEFILMRDAPRAVLASWWREAIGQLAAIVSIIPEKDGVKTPDRCLVTHAARPPRASSVTR
jgi:hypothetical protein